MPALSDVALQAAIAGNLRLLKLVASKMNLREAKDAAGRNALHLAAEMGRLEVCRFLVEESGFEVNFACAEGGSPVHCAAAGGSESVLGYLLDHGGDPVMPDSMGSTPLHDAAEEGHCAAVRMLLSKGVDVDPHGCRGTPLHLACSNDRDQVVRILLEHGADPNKVVGHVLPPLMMAYCGGSLRCMKLLIEVYLFLDLT
ncbi:ankyrin repeat family protein [Zea mays]|uniref:Ankyrin repeat family protein n=1 Tax=Zea mays TaxID=4577 RepID=A0A1D6KFG6_MAIZE|nr:ankyrin repeat family protein [Zea mays]